MNYNEFILYGLSKHKQVIDKIITELNAYRYNFDIRLILTEGLTNAFKHGNKMNADKPIHLKYFYNGKSVKFEIKDCGTGLENVIIDEEAQDENLLMESGRGLFIIRNLSDKIELKQNTLIVQKCLSI
jgi:Anti-sigma regulatory factor (Ser/Thr protein kinase)